jgi:hypothetical protein
MKNKRLTITFDTEDLSDQTNAWDWNEDVMAQLGVALHKLADLCQHNAALPAGPILAPHGQTIGSIEWEDA